MADALRATTVVIDEVQRLPSLLNEVHRLIEARRFRFGAIDVLPFEEGLLGLPALLAAGRPK